MIYTVYTLRDSEGHVRYVGMTFREPLVRLQGHKAAPTAVGDWVRYEVEGGRAVRIVTEQTFECGNHWKEKLRARYDAAEAERKCIDKHRKIVGDQLLNRTRKVSKLLLVGDQP